jgi:hypothetical protein
MEIQSNIEVVSANSIKLNDNNPRIIKDDKYRKLVKSLKTLPIMLFKRPVIIDEDRIIIGGNMRYRAAKEAGMTTIPIERFTRADAQANNQMAKQLDVNYIDKTYEEQREEMIIKDNVSGGEWDWDIISSNYDTALLDEWGIDLPTGWGVEESNTETNDKPQDKDSLAIVVVAYNDINDLDQITDLYNLDCIDMTDNIKEQISSQRKMYVFKK